MAGIAFTFEIMDLTHLTGKSHVSLVKNIENIPFIDSNGLES